MTCPYCGKPAEWVENKEIYGRNIGKSYMMWLCRACDARVGCHNNTQKPLGTMANAELRSIRMAAHTHIDWFWKYGRTTRKDLYIRLAEIFGQEVHIGESDIETCKKIIALTEKELCGRR